MAAPAFARTVRVTRTGNSRALPLPADAARSAGLQVGDTVHIEVHDGTVIYRPGHGSALIVGEGSHRAGVVPRGRAVAIDGADPMGALDSWDF